MLTKRTFSLYPFIVLRLLKNYCFSVSRTSNIMEKLQIPTTFSSQFKLGRKSVETAPNFKDASGSGTTIQRMAQTIFKKLVETKGALKIKSVVVGFRMLITTN